MPGQLPGITLYLGQISVQISGPEALQTLKLLVVFSALVANSMKGPTCNAICPVATIQTGIVIRCFSDKII